MKRVLVIGCCGAGKSTFAVALGAATGLPVVHLDRLYWGPGWVITEEAEWEARLESALARERWILDGNYGRTMERRLARADTCVFLDMPRWVCLAGVLKRRVRHDRPDPLAGCRERVDRAFIRYVWRYRAVHRPEVLARLSRFETRGGRVVVLRSRRAARRFLRDVLG